MALQRNLIQGDLEALEVVYKKYYAKVNHIVLKYSRNAGASDDLTQEVFLKFWRNRHKINPDLTIDHQLFVISKNVVFNHLKSELRQRVMLEEYLLTSVELTADHTSVEEQMKGVKILINQLPKKQRQILQMHRFEGLSYDEIANYFGISKHTVATHLTNAMHYLRKNAVLKIWLLLLPLS